MKAVKKTPEQLREQAKRLLAEAERMENKRAIRIGNFVLKHAENGFEGFTLEALKSEISKT
jgi:hypothetical protein